MDNQGNSSRLILRTYSLLQHWADRNVPLAIRSPSWCFTPSKFSHNKHFHFIISPGQRNSIFFHYSFQNFLPYCHNLQGKTLPDCELRKVCLPCNRTRYLSSNQRSEKTIKLSLVDSHPYYFHYWHFSYTFQKWKPIQSMF